MSAGHRGGDLDATATAAAVRAGEVSAVALAERTLERIRELDPAVNSFSCLLADEALAAARRVDEVIARGDDPGLLAGVPVSIKDFLWVAGAPATFGSRAYRDFRPDHDAVLVERLRDAGAVIVGKTTNPELCFAGATASELTGTTRNPWHHERTPGGSSGGAGASLALGLTPLAIGSDGGGSIRIPASFCGVAGHKPTFGLVPATPGFRSWPTLSAKGPMASSVRDLALCLDVIAGHDARDPTTQPRPPVACREATRDPDVGDLRIAFSADLGFAALEPGVRQCFDAAIDAFARAGWRLEEAYPETGEPTVLWNRIALAEGFASQGHLLAGHADDLEPRTAAILRYGDVPAAEYLAAMAERDEFVGRWLAFFDRFDVLLTPATQLVAFDAGLTSPAFVGDHAVDPDVDDWAGVSLPANLTGMPAASIPCGLNDVGLPVGLQLMGRRFEDAVVLRTAATAEAILPPIGLAPA